MAEKLDTAKGLIRGLTADWLGGPVDLATLITNLGIAGGGYVAHKLGLVNTPPDLLDPKNVPFSSDWHVKNSPLENPGTAAYAAGQFTGNLLPGIGSFTKGLAAPRKGQTNALYPGGSDEFLLGHATNANTLLPQAGKAELRKELYHPSWGITKNSPPPDFGDTYLIPDPKKFEPKVSPTVIRAVDFYSPRYTDSRTGGGFDALQQNWQNNPNRWEAENALKYYESQLKKPDLSADDADMFKMKVKNLQNYLVSLRKQTAPSPELAENRLRDRFDPRFPKGGLWGEGAGASSTLEDPSIDTFHRLRVDLSPRFQTFKHFAESPVGGAVVDAKKGKIAPNLTDSLETTADKVLEKLGFSDISGNLVTAVDMPRSAQIEFMKGLASGKFPHELSFLTDPNSLSWEKIDPVQYRDTAQFFQKLLQKLKTVPTEYAEAKTFGPVGLNADNIAGIISKEQGNLGQLLAEAAKKRNIPFVQSPLSASPDSIFRAAVQMQNNALYRGMGGR